jgi:2-hydroxychromene-2-carboxylate isomerase
MRISTASRGADEVGVFGVPSAVVQGELFWGAEATFERGRLDTSEGDERAG